MRAHYRIFGDPDHMPGMQPWIDMPEAEPRTRVRLHNGDDPDTFVSVDDDGQLVIDPEGSPVDTDTTYEG